MSEKGTRRSAAYAEHRRLEDELPGVRGWQIRIGRIEYAGIERGIVVGHVVGVEVVGNAVRAGNAGQD